LPENFKADFVQKVTNSNKKSIEYSGKVYFSDESLLKWEYLEPTKKEVCTDGVELVVVDHDLEQVSYYFIDQKFNFTAIVKKAELYKDNIYVAEYQEKKYTIQLDRQQRLHSIAYYDDLENMVQIVFKHIVYGKGKLPVKQITCRVPKTYDVIRG
jgi:outer membrane lipoprotein carrier protein